MDIGHDLGLHSFPCMVNRRVRALFAPSNAPVDRMSGVNTWDPEEEEDFEPPHPSRSRNEKNRPRALHSGDVRTFVALSSLQRRRA